MADKTSTQGIGQIYSFMAELHKEIGDLSIAMTVLQFALQDLIPGFADRYKAHTGNPKVLEAKTVNEVRTLELHELARRMSKN